MENPAHDGSDPQNRRQMIDRAEQSWQAWVNAIEGIPDERLAEPMVGHWSGKDLLGHIAFWEDWAIGECQRIIAGEPDPGDDMDDVNEGQVAESKDTSVAEQKRYRDDAHARLAAFLGTIRDDEPTFPQLVKTLAAETYKHYDEHTAQVRAWRDREGLKA